MEQAHHQLLFGSSFEGFLLSSPPELPHANVAGAKLEIFWFFGLGLGWSIHDHNTTSTASEHC